MLTFYFFDIKESIKALLGIFWEDEKTELVVLNIYSTNSLQVSLYNESYEQIKWSDKCKLLCIRIAIRTVANESKIFSILGVTSVQNVPSCFSKSFYCLDLGKRPGNKRRLLSSHLFLAVHLHILPWTI